MSELRVPLSGRGLKYTQEEIELVAKVMQEADPMTQGKYQTEFETTFARKFNASHAFAVATGTAALELSAILCGLKEGDEVILPAHTFAATAIPFARTGAKLVWADIDPDTFLVSPESVKERISPRTKVIVIVHLYGQMPEMDRLMELARGNSCLVVEDAAQAIGGSYKGKAAGTWGDFGCFSFHTAKNISTLGEGGMLTVKSSAHAAQVPGLRHNGMRPFPEPREKYWIPAMSNVDFDLEGVWPYNFCLGEIQCALGTKQLERLDTLNRERTERAKDIRKRLAHISDLKFQKIHSDNVPAYHLLPIEYLGPSRDRLMELLYREYAIKTDVRYCPLYRYPMFQKAGFGGLACPNSDRFFDRMFSIPFHHWLTPNQVDYMIDSLGKACTFLRKE